MLRKDTNVKQFKYKATTFYLNKIEIKQSKYYL